MIQTELAKIKLGVVALSNLALRAGLEANVWDCVGKAFYFVLINSPRCLGLLRVAPAAFIEPMYF